MLSRVLKSYITYYLQEFEVEGVVLCIAQSIVMIQASGQEFIVPLFKYILSNIRYSKRKSRYILDCDTDTAIS